MIQSFTSLFEARDDSKKASAYDFSKEGGHKFLMGLVAKFGKDAVLDARKKLTVGEFKARFGLEVEAPKKAPVYSASKPPKPKKDKPNSGGATAQKASKDFEQQICDALMGGPADDAAQRAAKHIQAKVSTVTEAYQLNGHFPGYKGTKGSLPKADIIVVTTNKTYSVSVKYEGNIILQSAENPFEFKGLFIGAFETFRQFYKDKEVDLHKPISHFQKQVETFSQTHVGGASGIARQSVPKINGLLKSIDRKYQSTVDKVSDPATLKVLEKARKDIIERLYADDKKFQGEYNTQRIKLENDIKTFIGKELFANKDLKKCIIHEAVTGYNKFKDKAPFNTLSKMTPMANFIVNPSGFHDVRDVDSSYLTKIGGGLWYELQNVPGASLGSGGARSYFEYLADTSGRKKKLSFEDAIKRIQQVSLSSKIKISSNPTPSKAILEDTDILLEEIADLYEQKDVLMEGKINILKRIKDKVKTFFSKLFDWVKGVVASFQKEVKELLTNLNAFYKLDMFEALYTFRLAPHGKIKLSLP